MNRFWAAVTVSEFGTQVTTLAMPLFVLVTLNGSATDVGLLNAARWAPYLLCGLLAGALIDRWRRLPVLVTADLGRALLLGTAALFVRDLTLLLVIMFLVGLLSLGHDIASQSFLPRLVDRSRLPQANARLAQTGSAAAATGPLVGGGLVGALGAPLSIVLDAVSYLVCGLLLATLKTAEPPAPAKRGTIREGLAWVYGHPMLRPLALNTHAWMIFSAAAGAVYVPFALRVLGLSPFELGATLAAAGVGGVLGGAVSTTVAERLGLGRSAVTARFLPIVAFGLIAVSDGWVMAAAGQFLFWFGISVESPSTIAFRQAVTPDRLQGRMNATIRSLNWGMVTIGAPLGGLLADTAGHRVALGVATAGFALTAVTFACSRFRFASVHGGLPVAAQ
ncbi:MFS transporter [Lentzea alba]|uniref:MFS transporter n=1 Tax=Lentzea alba TaxID=2714351 RepID=UPI0039BF7DE6